MNQIPNLPVNIEPGYLKANESFVFYPIPGSRVVKTFMNGTTEQQLNFEFAMKSKVQSKINQTLWVVSNALETITELQSDDNSFEFDEIIITNKPFINQADDQGFFTFLLNIQAKITVLKGDK